MKRVFGFLYLLVAVFSAYALTLNVVKDPAKTITEVSCGSCRALYATQPRPRVKTPVKKKAHK